jgi:hypothetical protein
MAVAKHPRRGRERTGLVNSAWGAPILPTPTSISESDVRPLSTSAESLGHLPRLMVMRPNEIHTASIPGSINRHRLKAVTTVTSSIHGARRRSGNGHQPDSTGRSDAKKLMREVHRQMTESDRVEVPLL